MTKEQKSSFLLYLEHEEFINELSDEEAGKLIKGIFEYARTGQNPSLSAASRMAFISIRQDLDRNAEKYKAKCEALKLNGLKGGRPKKNIEKETDENQMVFDKTKKNFYENDNDNVNDNVLSLREEMKISKAEREILENYIIENKLATKNVKAYASKIISNGDWKTIIETESKKALQPKEQQLSREERIQKELSSIFDKQSCAKVLVDYYMRGSPPEEFNEVMEKYDLDTYSKIEEYARELSNKKS